MLAALVAVIAHFTADVTHSLFGLALLNSQIVPKITQLITPVSEIVAVAAKFATVTALFFLIRLGRDQA